MQDHILVSVSPFYNGHGWTDHGTGIDFKPVNGLRAFRIDLKDDQDLRGIRNSIRLNHLLLLEGELPEMGEVRPEDANPAELTHKEYTTLLEGLRSDGDSSELVSELESTKADLVNANGQITQLNSQLVSTKDELATANSQNIQLDSELQSTKAELQTTEAGLATANGEVTRLESELDSKKTELDSKDSQITQLQSDLQGTESDLAEANRQKAELQSDLDTANGQITQLQATIDSLQAQLDALQEGSDGDVEPQSLGYTQEELEGKTVAELQQLAEDENIELTSTLKADIIQEILNAQ